MPPQRSNVLIILKGQGWNQNPCFLNARRAAFSQMLFLSAINHDLMLKLYPSQRTVYPGTMKTYFKHFLDAKEYHRHLPGTPTNYTITVPHNGDQEASCGGKLLTLSQCHLTRPGSVFSASWISWPKVMGGKKLEVRDQEMLEKGVPKETGTVLFLSCGQAVSLAVSLWLRETQILPGVESVQKTAGPGPRHLQMLMAAISLCAGC